MKKVIAAPFNNNFMFNLDFEKNIDWGSKKKLVLLG